MGESTGTQATMEEKTADYGGEEKGKMGKGVERGGEHEGRERKNRKRG